MSTVATVIANLQTALATAQSFGAPPPPIAPTISNFAASPASLPAGGGSVTLSATIVGSPTPTLTLNGAAVTLPATVNVAVNTTFALVATNSAGSASASVSVAVAIATGGSILANLAAGKCRILGAYSDPDPQFTAVVPRPTPPWPSGSASAQILSRYIMDDSGVIEFEPGVIGVAGGGGHGPSVQTNPRVVDLRGSPGAAAVFKNLCASVPVTQMNYPYLVANPAAIDVEYGCYRDPANGTIRGPTCRHSWRLQTARGREIVVTQWRGFPDWIVPSSMYWGGRIFAFNLDTQQYWFSAIPQNQLPWDPTSAAVLDPTDGKILIVGSPQTAHTLVGGGPANLWLYDRDADTITYGPSLNAPNNPGAVLDCVYWNGFFWAIQRDGSVWKITRNANFSQSTCVPITVSGTRPAYTGTYNVGVALIGSKVYGLMSDGQGQFGANTVANQGKLRVLDLATGVWSVEQITMEDSNAGYLPGQSDAAIAVDSLSGCLVFFWNPSWGTLDSHGNVIPERAYAYRPL
jgi:hypothetical protein